MSNAIAGVNTEFQRYNGYGWETIAEIISIDGPGLSRTMINVTNLSSAEGWAEFIGGIKDGGLIKLEMIFTQHTYSVMKVDFLNKSPQTYRVILPDVLLSTINFDGLVKDLPINISYEGAVKCSVGIKITGMVTDSFTEESIVVPESFDVPSGDVGVFDTTFDYTFN